PVGPIAPRSRSARFSRIVDLSQSIGPKTPMFPAYPPPTFTQWTTREAHGFLAESMFMVTHTGTHVDAPFHFEPSGRTLDDVPIDRFIAPWHVLDIRGLHAKEAIRPEHLRSARRHVRGPVRNWEPVLLRTGRWARRSRRPAYLS